MKIITNNQPRPILYYPDLTEEEKAELDYIKEDKGQLFFRYKGEIYDLGEFSPTNSYFFSNGNPFGKWDGYLSDSFFSGIVVKFTMDEDIGMYY
jgi:hypothetical protein